MKIISKSFFLKKSIIKFFVCFFLLMLSLLFLLQIRNGVIEKIEIKKNAVLSQKIIVKLKENNYFEEIQDFKYIESIEKIDENEYIIVFSQNKYIDIFIAEYEIYFSDIVFFESNEKNSNEQELMILKSLEIGLTYLIVIFVVIILVLLILLMVEISIENKNIVSYYKLIGYKNFTIIKHFFISLLCLFLTLAILSIFINNIVTMILREIFNNQFFNYNTYNIYICIISFLLLFLMIISSIFYFKIYNVSPINFKNKNYF